MVNVAHQSDTSLPYALVARARSASDGHLAFDAAAGAIVAIVIAGWRPPHWLPLTCAALCVGTFGAWGIADRELRERRVHTQSVTVMVLRVARFLAAALGVVSALSLIFAVLSVTLGTWIS
jgi:hypothetical protein